MTLMDRLTGTRRPTGGTPTLDAPGLRARLLGLNGPDRPWWVRDGAPEGLDLVAEWHVDEPAIASNADVYRRSLLVFMRLDVVGREVRALDEQRSVALRHGRPVWGGRGWSRGPSYERSVQWTLGPEGLTRTFDLDTRKLEDPLRDTVTAAGWTWKGLAFRRP